MKIYTSIEKFRGVENPILTTGTFDGVHIGHQKIIEQLNKIAREEGGSSTLLTFYPHPRMVLFPDDDSLKLIHSQTEKIERLEKAGLEHLIVSPFTREFSRLTHTEYVRDVLVNQIGVHKVVIGYDHHFGRNREGNLQQLKEMAVLYDFGVEEIPAQTVDDVNVSSTKIRRALLEGDVETASGYLGYNFRLSGLVVRGDQIGRKIGYPTANMQMVDRHKIVPGKGVYAVKVKIRNSWHNGMMNIGVRPTITGAEEERIEVHVLKLNEEFYDEIITVEFVQRIRDEKRFDSTESLKEQIKLDELKTKNILDECVS